MTPRSFNRLAGRGTDSPRGGIRGGTRPQRRRGGAHGIDPREVSRPQDLIWARRLGGSLRRGGRRGRSRGLLGGPVLGLVVEQILLRGRELRVAHDGSTNTHGRPSTGAADVHPHLPRRLRASGLFARRRRAWNGGWGRIQRGRALADRRRVPTAPTPTHLRLRPPPRVAVRVVAPIGSARRTLRYFWSAGVACATRGPPAP